MKVLVRGPLSMRTDFGQDTIGLVRALVGIGADVQLQPHGVDAPLPSPIAALLTREYEPPYDLGIFIGDPESISPTSDVPTDVLVGWTGHGSTSCPDNLIYPINRFDAVLAYDRVTAEAISCASQDQLVPPVRVLSTGFWPGVFRRVKRDWSSKMSFALVGPMTPSSDFLTAVQVFKELKEDPAFDASLNIYTPAKDVASEMESMCPDLRVTVGPWTPEKRLQFYSKQHVLLALSRGDVKNRTALEFACTGGAVATMNWGANTSWLSSSYAYPLSFTIEDSTARASRDHLRELMLNTCSNRADVQRRAVAAQSAVPQMCSWLDSIERLFLVLAECVPGKGEALRSKALLCEPPTRDGFDD